MYYSMKHIMILCNCTVVPIVPSSAPTSFSATVLSARSVEASWQAPPPEDRNGVIIAYIINVTSLRTGLTRQMNSTTTSVTATNLAPFTTYICIIAASTAVGLGPFSTTITFRTLESGNFDYKTMISEK